MNHRLSGDDLYLMLMAFSIFDHFGRSLWFSLGWSNRGLRLIFLGDPLVPLFNGTWHTCMVKFWLNQILSHDFISIAILNQRSDAWHMP